jgi:hypothetical protein
MSGEILPIIGENMYRGSIKRWLDVNTVGRKAGEWKGSKDLH